MSRRDYVPGADAALLAYSLNFSNLIAAAPADYGLAEPDIIAYGEAQVDYTTKLTAAVEPLTRGKRTVFLKDEAKKTLVALTRTYAREINNRQATTDAQRQGLGLTIRSDSRQPLPEPDMTPFIKVKGVDGRTVTIELQQESSRRGRPAGVSGATIFTHIGPAQPGEGEQWQFAANVTRTRVDLPFAPSQTGDTVWITAFWTNARGSSPASVPVSVNLPAGGVLPTEMDQEMRLKMAA